MANDMALAREIDTLRNRLGKVREKSKQEVEQITDAALTAGASFGFAYLQGRYPTKAQVGQVPLSLIAGGGLLIGGLMKWIPEGQYVASVGSGAIAAYAAMKGFASGQEAAQKDQKP